MGPATIGLASTSPAGSQAKRPTLAAGVTVHAPAKVNLYLDVLCKRDDGFHEIETLIAPIGLFDTLRFRPSEPTDGRIRLRVHACPGPGRDEVDRIPTDGSNLVVKALEGLRELLGVTSGLTVDLWKRIPSRAGLGGGSSDAAAALRAGLELWGPLAPAELSHGEIQRGVLDLAAKIGSDVPVMVEQKAAVCRGRGERIEHAALPSGMPCVLVQPRVGLGAAEVYSDLRPEERSLGRQDQLPGLLAALRAGRLQQAGRLMTNTLQQPAERLADAIGPIREAFTRLRAPAHLMSGSGTVYFGLFENWRTARSAAARLRQMAVGREGWVGLAATL